MDQSGIVDTVCCSQIVNCVNVREPFVVDESDQQKRHGDPYLYEQFCDLGIETVTDTIAKFAKSYEKRLQDHINIEAPRLLNVNNITRRLKRKKPFELVIR
jgi:hypothetical protein